MPIGEPSCADAVAAAPPAPTPEEVRAAAEAAKQAAAGGAVTNVRGIKARGAVVSTTDSTVTITPDPQMSDQLGEITATVGPATEFYDGDTKVDTRPPLAPGDEVMFVASSADDASYQLMVLAVHVPEKTASSQGHGRRAREVGDRASCLERRIPEGCIRGGVGAARFAHDPVHRRRPSRPSGGCRARARHRVPGRRPEVRRSRAHPRPARRRPPRPRPWAAHSPSTLSPSRPHPRPSPPGPDRRLKNRGPGAHPRTGRPGLRRELREAPRPLSIESTAWRSTGGPLRNAYSVRGDARVTQREEIFGTPARACRRPLTIPLRRARPLLARS